MKIILFYLLILVLSSSCTRSINSNITYYPECHSLMEIDKATSKDSSGYTIKTYVDDVRHIKAIVSYKKEVMMNAIKTPSVTLRVFYKDKDIALCTLDSSEFVSFSGVEGTFTRNHKGEIVVSAANCSLPEYRGAENILFAFIADKALEFKPMDQEEFKKHFAVLKLQVIGK